MKKISVKEIVKYNGHSLKPNGSVDLSFKAMYEEIVNSIKVLQMLNNDVKIICKLPGVEPFELGIFRVKNVSFDGDGESVLKFNSLDINVELDNLNRIVTSDAFQIRLKAIIEGEDDE